MTFRFESTLLTDLEVKGKDRKRDQRYIQGL